MSNRIDKLFKDKLSEHKVTPAAQAWTRVQSGLSKKNKIIIVWRIAAVFLLFGTMIGTWFLLNNDDAIRPAQLTRKKEITSPQKDVLGNPVEVAQSTKPKMAQTAKPEKRIVKNLNKKVSQNAIIEPDALNNSELQKEAEGSTVLTEHQLTAQPIKKEKPIVIEFTLESVSTKPVVSVAQTSGEETSGLKKIFDAALDVKNGESDLGIIREAKNQLFALDFRKSKPKRN